MILNFGSINLDLVYRVPHMPAPGETLSATDHQRHLGGKGVNQSIAVSHAGSKVRHIGCVGEDGAWVRDQMAGFGLSLDDIRNVLILNPDHFSALSGLALILEQMGQPEAALEAWREVEKLHPNRDGLADAKQRLEREVEGRSL